MDRVKEIREKIKGRLHIALYSANGIKLGLMKKCSLAGVTKVKVNKLVLDDYSEHLRTNTGKLSQTKLMEQGV